LHGGKLYIDGASKTRHPQQHDGAHARHTTIRQAGTEFAPYPARRLGACGAGPVQTINFSQRNTMGQHRQSQSNDEKNTGRKRTGKQQRANDAKTSSSPSARSPAQQQGEDARRSQQGASDSTAPRAGSTRDADNPSLSANQEDRHGQDETRRGRDSVEGLPSDDGSSEER
jgi:hypothetical protein